MPQPFDLLPTLLSGAKLSLLSTLLATPFVLIISLIAGLSRTYGPPIVRLAAASYVELFRGSALLVELFYFFYVLPFFGIVLDPITTGVMVLSLNSGAYGSEIVRAAVLAIDRGQWEAASALNMPRLLTLRRVILPQALPAMIPPFTNLIAQILLATSLLSLIGITDLTQAGRNLFFTTGRTTQIYTLIPILYFLMAYPMILLSRWTERHFRSSLATGRPA